MPTDNLPDCSTDANRNGQLSDWCGQLQAGQPRSFGELTVVPLHSWKTFERDYLLLGEAIEQKTFHVTEVSEGGSVPELRAVNRSDRPVLLFDGEELIGAKQNRVLNLTVLVAAQTELKVPVSCVEQGRWRYSSAAFMTSDRALFAKARAHKSRDVTQSMTRGARAADQGALWRAVADKLEEMKAESPTLAMSDAYEQRAHALGGYVDALAHPRGESGAVFALSGVPVAVEAFDSPDAFRIALPKLIRSFALDAVQRGGCASNAELDDRAVDGLLQRISQANTARYQAIGLGEDLRVQSGNGLAGGALVVGERLVHLSVFDERIDE